ncbi:cadherin EGF LAG seven-pass G-type receptor 2-like isoform X2 [Haliotis cracherodii]|uniref:cadherin EGF LAG seven-pass G-type receptor 2-like isoform X2 n=1 Tax=Haliotis cracherodii TaxID=6455 RepID=UPI0039ED60DE
MVRPRMDMKKILHVLLFLLCFFSFALATTTPTPPTCGPMTDASLDEDCTNARCVAVNSSCVTTSAGSRRCACVNKNVQISATECALGPSILSSTTNYVFSTDLSRTSVTVGSIMFDGLSTFPTNTFSIEGKVYPDEGILDLKRNSTHIDVALVKEISNAKTFVVALRATSGEFTVQQVVTVRITSSSFTPEDVTVMLVEGTSKGTLIADVRTTGSLGGYSNFEMETTDQTARALFNVTTSGQVLCGQDMFLSDFTNNDTVAKEYIFSVKATNGGQRATTATFYILLFKSTFTTTLRENWTGNILSYTITSTKFQVAINDTLPDRLKLSKDLMTISLVKEIDYDAGITSIHFKLDLVTTTSTKSTSVDVHINIEDQNDHSPRFDKPNYQSEITTWEWVTNNPVDVFDVTDDDSGTNGLFILSMSGETDKFYIDGDTVGVLRIKEGASQPVASTTYNFDITATDKGSPSQSVTVPVSVDVKKIQGTSSLRFSSKDFRFSIVENRLYTTSFGRANAAHDANVSVRYTLIHGGDFRIDPSSGALTCSTAQDRETAANHTMVVRARDIATNASDVAVVTVQILDVNDNGPIFLASSGQHVFQVKEYSTGKEIGRIIAKDGDADENGRITYSIVSQTPRAHFSINPGTGIVTVSGDLDREDYDTYNLIIKATDNADAPRTATTSATILVDDINDNPPTFQTTYAVTVKEDSAISASVAIVSATDRDLSQHGAVTYFPDTVMVNGTVCPFKVSVETGVVKVSGDLDYETTSTYECTVTAVDMKGCSNCTGRLTGSTTMSVTILDFNDNPPVFQGAPYRANISRDANINTLVTDVITATDRDDTKDGNGVVKYHILSSIDYFRIDRDSGSIYVASTLDKVNDDVVTLMIKATDLPQNDPAMEAITNITISILTEQPRPFFRRTYTFLLTENEKPDDNKVVSIRAYVRRASEEVCDCTYDLIGSDNSSLYIDSMTGDLRQKDPIDREKTGSRFYVRVKATDRHSLLYNTTDVEVNVKDVNDNVPYFNNTQQNFIVNQNVLVGHVIGRVISVDADELSHPIYTAFTDVEGIELLGDGTLVVRASLSKYTVVDMHMKRHWSFYLKLVLKLRLPTSGQRTSTATMLHTPYKQEMIGITSRSTVRPGKYLFTLNLTTQCPES